MKKNSYLYEIGTEEIPASYILPAISFIEEYFSALLAEAQLTCDNLRTYSTPRRLCIVIEGLPDSQEDSIEEIVGPPKKIAYDEEGNLNKVGSGFLRKYDLSEEAITIKQLPKGEYLAVRKHSKGKSAEDILKMISTEVVPKIPFPKKMHWGTGSLYFARPIRWLLALYNNSLLEFSIDGLNSDRYSKGNRFQNLNNLITIDTISNYVPLLKKHYVLADRTERRNIIINEIEQSAKTVNGTPVEDAELLEIVTDLVEYPSPILGSFDSSFLELPSKVLTTTLSETQKCFSVQGSDGNLLPNFIGIGNSNPDTIDKVLYGNERVITARLSDAKFYFDTDKKIALIDRVDDLKKITFIKNLGTLFDKTKRMQKLGQWCATQLGYNTDKISRAALLSKCDLTTLILGEKEYTKLQGYMGWQYALSNGEDKEVAEALFEQYLPRSKNDILPHTKTGILLSIVDKIDTIVGCFSIDLQPTGTSDPLGIRRAGNGIISILADRNLSLELDDFIVQSMKIFDLTDNIVKEKITDFFIQRIKAYLEQLNIEYDVINAVIESQHSDISDVILRANNLQMFKSHEDFRDFIIGFKRASNILEKSSTQAELDESLLQENAEQALYNTLTQMKPIYEEYLSMKDYNACFIELVKLKDYIDAFFDEVMVMVEDAQLRENRMALLRLINSTFTKTADLSKIVYEL